MLHSDWAYVGLWFVVVLAIAATATLYPLDVLSMGVRAIARRIRARRR